MFPEREWVEKNVFSFFKITYYIDDGRSSLRSFFETYK